MACRALVVLLLAVGCRRAAGPTAPDAAPSGPAPVVSSTPAERRAVDPDRWPAAIDRTLGAPSDYGLVDASGGKGLFAVRTSIDVEYGGRKAVQSPSYWFGVYDLGTGCLEETIDFPMFFGASGSSPGETLAILDGPKGRAELERARALAKRFPGESLFPGTRDAAHVFLELNNQVYGVGPDGDFAHVGKVAVDPVVSNDERFVAFSECGSPCGGTYRFVSVEIATGKRSRPTALASSDIFAGPGSRYLVAHTNARGRKRATKVCMHEIDAATGKARELACVASSVGSADVATVSPNGEFFALQIEGEARAMHVFATATGELLYRVLDQPIGPLLDDRGSLWWQEILDEPEGLRRADVDGREFVRPSDIVVAGFRGHDDVVIGVPRAERFPMRVVPVGDVPRCENVRIVPRSELGFRPIAR